MGESQSRDPAGHTSKDRFTALPVAQVFPSAHALEFLHMLGALPGGGADEQNTTAIHQPLRAPPSLSSYHVLTTTNFCPFLSPQLFFSNESQSFCTHCLPTCCVPGMQQVHCQVLTAHQAQLYRSGSRDAESAMSGSCPRQPMASGEPPLRS